MAFQKEIKPEDYKSSVYVNKDRWVSYHYQTNLVSKYFPDGGKLAEIGVGNGVVIDFLKSNYHLTTIDINQELKPDIVASVDDLSVVEENSFDGVLCFEVLEHLPFSDFNKSLKEMSRVSKKFIFLSLPYWGYTFGFKLRLPMIGTKIFKFKINGFKRHQFNGQHYWEIGKQGFPLSLVKTNILEANLKIVNLFWDLDDPYHYYFVLEK